ncbi:hypothetical protein KNN17_16685 [Arthrobacter bambusae]|uniref:hypothetical protein n=1 Tax=Arthrobacter bambusae TaxID=1338426 RepID=UPI001F505248|nr:hypothetical protein [Arthrobacter bambusae]MCI0143203.1 hypothetical protein [Arthrobacter bambusae]
MKKCISFHGFHLESLVEVLKSNNYEVPVGMICNGAVKAGRGGKLSNTPKQRQRRQNNDRSI